MTIRQKWWLLAACVLLVAAGGVYLLRGPGEPSYEGKSANYWFRKYCLYWLRNDEDKLSAEEAAAALKQIGANAVSYLLKQAFNPWPDSAPIEKVCQWLDNLPYSWGLPVFVGSENRSRAKRIRAGGDPPAGESASAGAGTAFEVHELA